MNDSIAPWTSSEGVSVSIHEDILRLITKLEVNRKPYMIDILSDMMSTDRRYIRRRARRLGVTFFASSTRPRVYTLNLMG